MEIKYGCRYREDILLAKKTEENAILTASMVEDVKGRGGSGYVVGKDKQVIECFGKESPNPAED